MRKQYYAAGFSIVLAACGGGANHAAGGGGSGNTTVSAGEAGTGTPSASSTGAGAACQETKQCNAPPQCARFITGQLVAEAPPAPTHGAVADGTYALTASTIYTGVGGPNQLSDGLIGITLVIEAGAFRMSTTTANADGSGASTTGASGTIALTAGAANQRVHCPSAATVDVSYSVDPSGSLHLFAGLADGITSENVFALQR